VRNWRWIPSSRGSGVLNGRLAFEEAIKRVFHGLRHAVGTIEIGQGFSVKLIQEILGHSQLSTTMDVYGHLFSDATRAGLDRMGKLL
jgi:integrase